MYRKATPRLVNWRIVAWYSIRVAPLGLAGLSISAWCICEEGLFLHLGHIIPDIHGKRQQVWERVMSIWISVHGWGYAYEVSCARYGVCMLAYHGLEMNVS